VIYISNTVDDGVFKVKHSVIVDGTVRYHFDQCISNLCFVHVILVAHKLGVVSCGDGLWKPLRCAVGRCIVSVVARRASFWTLYVGTSKIESELTCK